MNLRKPGFLTILLTGSLVTHSALAQSTLQNATCESQECISAYKKIKRSTPNLRAFKCENTRESAQILVNMHLHGYGTKKDVRKAERLLQKLSVGSRGSDFLKTKYALNTLFKGKQDTKLALKRLTTAAENDSPEANLILALLFQHGIKLDQNPELASRHFATAKSLGVDVNDDLLVMEREAHQAVLDELLRRYNEAVFDLEDVEQRLADNKSTTQFLTDVSDEHLAEKKRYTWIAMSLGSGYDNLYVRRPVDQ